jgi:arylsulfatase A-like enzyme
MDTVRADHLSCYGYARKTTPSIDEIAKEGTLYQNAFATAPWTPPSHASIFTGKYPSHHRTLGKDVCLSSENTTIAENLATNGYRTFGVTCCQILGPGSGFEKGFDQYIESKDSKISDVFNQKGAHARDFVRKMIYGPDKGTYQATEEIKNFIKRNKASNKPFFVFVNYFTAHTPYDPPSPFKRKFCQEFDESFTYFQELLMKGLLKRTSERISKKNMDLKKLKWVASGGGGFSFSVKETTVSKEEWEIVRSWYDGEIAYLDHQIGRLVNFIKENDIFHNTFLMITADHGENFGEHSLAVHPLCLYDSLLRVPLVVSCPDSVPRGTRVQGLVSLVDIFPTALEAANIKQTSEGVDGKSLYPFDAKDGHDFVCAEYGALHSHGFGGLQAWSLNESTRSKLLEIDKGCKSIRDSTYKYILRSDREELYDVRKDPNEETNLMSVHPDVARRLKKQLEQTVDLSFMGSDEFPKQQRKQILDRLKALGYI